MADGGIFVYHPLGAQTELFAVYTATLDDSAAAATEREVDPAARSYFFERYARHLGGALREPPPAALVNDARPLVQRFHAFFPALLARTSLTEHAARVNVFFPVFDRFDCRCLDGRGRGEAIFITSRTLDLIELLARTLSLCVRLNGLELPAMVAADPPAGGYLLLAWMNMFMRAVPDVFGFEEIVAAAARGAEPLREHLAAFAPAWFSEGQRRCWGHYRVTRCLAWLMLREVNRLAGGGAAGAGGEDDGALLAVARDGDATSLQLSLDSRYLATQILSFVVLHEIGHLALGNNALDGGPVSPVERAVAEAAVKAAEEGPGDGVVARDLIGTAVGHETGADNFALEVTNDDDTRDVLLEAATLWCAALAGTSGGCGDWLRNHADNPTSQHPDYAMRVWYMNGRFSKGRRQGAVAQDITRQTQALAASFVAESGAPAPTGAVAARAFQQLWSFAKQKIRATDSGDGR
jgi:hypothetical protein